MQYRDFQGEKLSLLGFGTMRLPLMADGHTIDEAKVAEMTAYAMKNGVNYFDTAYPYHGGMSEVVMGRVLSAYPRESYYLASKYPGHQIASSYDPAAVFEHQLKKCGVEYFDFYLLHNVCETSLGVYTDDRWDIVEYFLRQKAAGRIRHLGFSSHGAPDNLREFLDRYGDKMEFAQIQLNYLDYTLQNAGEKYDLLTARDIPVWVMEPVRGGRLARLAPEQESRLRAVRPEETPTAWAFRWLMRFPHVGMVLSGMSDMTQMRENIATFSGGTPLTDREAALLEELAEGMKNSLPCTACRYCCDGCPRGLDIPLILSSYNEVRFGKEGGMTPAMRMLALPEDKRPAACIGCGACAAACPQKIDIPAAMQGFAEALKNDLPDWVKISRQREEESRRLQG